MKARILGTSALLLLVGACATAGPAKMVYKAGSVRSERQLAVDECRIASFQQIPQNIATQVNPGYSNPGSISCNTIGGYTNCNRVGAINIPATAVNYDVNGELRARYIDRCLAEKGFAVVEMPICGPNQPGPDQNLPQPDLAQIPCVPNRPL